ncbi:MAG: TIR domain-containing protein, partial [Burkholderiaceae bacterium]
MRGIFISYRRDDAEGQAGRLFDDLSAHFGRDAVFMDVAGIKKGLDFRRIIDAHVASCGVLLVIIGKGWLSAKDSKGQRRLDDANDFVRLETAAALSRDIPVVPVLVHGAVMPTEHDLPDGLKELAFRNGTELTHARWESDVKLLIEDLRPYLDIPVTSTLAPQSTRDQSPKAAEDSAPRAISGSPSRRSVWATVAALMVVTGAATLGYRLWMDDFNSDARPVQLAQVSPIPEPARKPDTPPATSPVPVRPAQTAIVEPTKPEPTPAQSAASIAAAAEAAAARVAAAKAAAARAEAARLELARREAVRLEAARRAADDQRKREEAERAALLAETQRKRDEEVRKLAAEQA